MIIDVRSLAEGHSELSQDCMLDAVRPELPPFSAVHCTADLDKNGATVYAHVRFRGDFDLECARCLGRFTTKIEGDLRLVIKEEAGKHGPDPDGEPSEYFYDSRDSQVDIAPALFDEIMIALPLMPLCSPDCKGIEAAPDVRVEYGPSASDKEPGEIDPRWQALKRLKEKGRHDNDDK